MILIYISIIKEDNIKVLYYINRKSYLIDYLKVYILLYNNIIGSKKIILDIT